MENDKSFSTNYFTHDNSKDNYRAIEFSVFYLIEAADSKRNLISKLLQINDFRFRLYIWINVYTFLVFLHWSFYQQMQKFTNKNILPLSKEFRAHIYVKTLIQINHAMVENIMFRH